MAHRIRETWNDETDKFFGPVEIDETYIGGKGPSNLGLSPSLVNVAASTSLCKDSLLDSLAFPLATLRIRPHMKDQPSQ